MYERLSAYLLQKKIPRVVSQFINVFLGRGRKCWGDGTIQTSTDWDSGSIMSLITENKEIGSCRIKVLDLSFERNENVSFLASSLL